MSIQQELLAEIEAFIKAKGIAETTFGRLAVNDWKFVERVRTKGITGPTIDRVRTYIRDHASAAQ